jgi:hypothetical protein
MRALLLGLALSAPGFAQAFSCPVAPAPALSPSFAPAPAALARMELAPFTDDRRRKELWKGDGKFDIVGVEAEGLSTQAEAWDQDDYASMSFLWQRQLGQALDRAGFAVVEAPAPAPSSGAQEAEARGRGARYLLGGEIRSLSIRKVGADSVFETTFSGVNYFYSMEARVVVKDLLSGAVVLDRDWSDAHGFHDPTPMGRRDAVAFPQYFLSGLARSAVDLARSGDLRAVGGLPPVATPTPSPTPWPDDGKPYWVHPKTGKRMDPSWNFDPSDGTPREDFVRRRPALPSPAPTPRPTPTYAGRP